MAPMATMPAKDDTGRGTPHKQPAMPTHRPAQPPARKIKLATRDPRARRSR